MAAPAIRWANYPHDHIEAIGRHMGPDRLGVPVTVVDARYDIERDTTRLGFAYGIHNLEDA